MNWVSIKINGNTWLKSKDKHENWLVSRAFACCLAYKLRMGKKKTWL